MTIEREKKGAVTVKKILIGLIVCSLFTVLVAACGVVNANQNAGPTVHMGATDFLQHTVTIQMSTTPTHQKQSTNLIPSLAYARQAPDVVNNAVAYAG
jgi:hypothetical protein